MLLLSPYFVYIVALFVTVVFEGHDFALTVIVIVIVSPGPREASVVNV